MAGVIPREKGVHIPENLCIRYQIHRVLPELHPKRLHKVIAIFIIIFNIYSDIHIKLAIHVLTFVFTAITATAFFRTHESGNYVVIGRTTPFHIAFIQI